MRFLFQYVLYSGKPQFDFTTAHLLLVMSLLLLST